MFLINVYALIPPNYLDMINFQKVVMELLKTTLLTRLYSERESQRCQNIVHRLFVLTNAYIIMWHACTNVVRKKLKM